MHCLQDAILVRPEFLELGLEELTLLICDSLLVEHQNIRDVVVVYLALSVSVIAF